MAPGCPAAPARAAAAPAARPAAPAAASTAGAASARAAAAARASTPVHRGHRCRCRRRRCSRRRRRGEVGAALGLGAGGYQPWRCGRLIAGAGGRRGFRALRGGLMDLQHKSREGRPKGTGCECSCCGARPPEECPQKCPPAILTPGTPSLPRPVWPGAAAGRSALLPATPVVPSCVSSASWGVCRTCRTSCTDRAYLRCGRACASSCRCCWRSAGRSPQIHTGTASPLRTTNMGACCGHSEHPPAPLPWSRQGLCEEGREARRA